MAIDNDAEQIFRENYAQELRKKNQSELEDERKKVNQQGMKTPGRRGEEIKHEEIDKEIVRRYKLSQKMT
jgi:predicted N-acyltransferase